MDLAMRPLATLLPKLAQLLQEEVKLQKGAREGISYLHDELPTMEAVLNTIRAVPRDQRPETQKIWAQNVRELSYDMEDIVDTFMVDIEGPDPPSKSGVRKMIKKMVGKVKKARARRAVSQEINDIKERAKLLADRHERYRVHDITPAKKTTVDTRLKAFYIKLNELVGIGEAKEEVIKMLMEADHGDERKRVVSIAGFGGLGKTTLAKAVQVEIKGQFACTAFVSVSRDYDTKKLLKDMLYDLDKKKFEHIHIEQLDEKFLIDKIIEYLTDKRYLIVIDDIWENKPWDDVISCALVENNKRSRIITTTRNIEVAEHVGSCYKLKPLSDESSEMLFYGRVFGSKGKCPARILDVSEMILKKCGGVPLAIITIASLLVNKSENIKEWYDVCNSIGSGLENNKPGMESMDNMRNILLLSYYDLPPHLKTCLLYMSIFPEDYEIMKDGLIWRWVAEGFVRQSQDQSFLEIGESYFNELLNRSLIQPAVLDDMDGTPQACRVHDLVLDLIKLLSREECFVTTVLEDGKHDKVRWLSLHTWPTMKIPKLRSLTIFKPDDVITDPILSFSHYHLLRVLDLGKCMLKDLASLGFLGSLSHLRYLALSSNSGEDDYDQLPVEIGKLRFLLILDLFHTRVKELPSSVVSGLGQLMCLRGSWDSTDLPVGLKNLTSLEVLQRVAVSSECIAEELGHLTQLRELEVMIRLSPPWRRVLYDDDDGDDDDDDDDDDADDGDDGDDDDDDDDDDYDKWCMCAKALVESLVESLGKLKKIEYLDLYHDLGGNGLDLDGETEEIGNLRWLRISNAMILPAWTLIPGITYLDIKVLNMEEEDIGVLSTLPCLRHLTYKVGYKATHIDRKKVFVVGYDAFPSVVWCKFDIYGIGAIPCIFQGGAMPKLQDFTFRIDLEEFRSAGGSTIDDLGLGHLRSLRSVTVLCIHAAYKEDEIMTSVRKKLEQEAVRHRHSPLRIEFSRRYY